MNGEQAGPSAEEIGAKKSQESQEQEKDYTFTYYPSNFYASIGLDPSASQEDIRRVYRKLSKKHHPDMVPPDQKGKATEDFENLNEINQILSDPEKRKAYDRGMGFDRQKQDQTVREAADRARAAGVSPEAAAAAKAQQERKNSWQQEASRGASYEETMRRADEAFARMQQQTNADWDRIRRETDESWANIRRSADESWAKAQQATAGTTERAQQQNDYPFDNLLTQDEYVFMNDLIKNTKTIEALANNLILFSNRFDTPKPGDVRGTSRNKMLKELHFQLSVLVRRSQNRDEHSRLGVPTEFDDTLIRKVLDRMSSRTVRDKAEQIVFG